MLVPQSSHLRSDTVDCPSSSSSSSSSDSVSSLSSDAAGDGSSSVSDSSNGAMEMERLERGYILGTRHYRGGSLYFRRSCGCIISRGYILLGSREEGHEMVARGPILHGVAVDV